MQSKRLQEVEVLSQKTRPICMEGNFDLRLVSFDLRLTTYDLRLACYAKMLYGSANSNRLTLLYYYNSRVQGNKKYFSENMFCFIL